MCAYDRLKDACWLYRTRIPEVVLAAGERLFLATDGLDFEG